MVAEFLPIQKLYYTDKKSLKNGAAIKEKGISHILVLGELDIPLEGEFLIKEVDVSNKETVLVKFSICHEQINIGVQNGGSLIIFEDEGLLCAIIVSYLTSSLGKNLSLEDGLNECSKVFGEKLSEDFKSQLEIWFNMGSRIDTKYSEWIQFKQKYKISYEALLPALMAQTSKKVVHNALKAPSGGTPPEIRLALTNASKTEDRIKGVHTLWKAKKLQLVSLPSPSIGNWGYMCSGCSKKLFAEENVILHSNLSPTRENISASTCSHILIEPLRWMGTELLSKSGKITCYNCKFEVGFWKWRGWKCSCGTKCTAAFGIEPSKVIYVKQPPAILTVSGGSTLKGSPGSKRRSRLTMSFSNINHLFLGNQEKKEKKEEKKEVPTASKAEIVFAENYDELPKDLQKWIIKAKLTPEQVNTNWYATTQVFRFVAKRIVFPCACPADENEKRAFIKKHRNRTINRIISTHEAAKALLIGSEHEALTNQFPNVPLELLEGEKVLEEDDEEGDDKDDEEEDITASGSNYSPLTDAFIKEYLSPIKPSAFPLEDPSLSNYIELITSKYISPNNPKDIFKLSDKLGKGGFGRVYLARANSGPRKGKLLAIKKMPHSTKKEKLSNCREIELLSCCKHKNVVQFHEAFLSKEEIWMAMEYMEGGSLKEASSNYSFTEPHLAYIAQQTLTALKYLHDNGLTHRDLKPGNIMLTISGVVKLIDFGLCDETSRLIRNPRMVGSPYWMPPEIVLKAPYNEKVDVWSLGVTLLQIIDKRGFDIGNGFKTLFLTAVEGRKSPFSSNSYSKELRTFIGAMLERDIKKRASVDQLLAHPFLEKADTRKSMENIIGQIFISNVVGMATGGI